MYISVNKTTVAHRPVHYAALASGTISHVWSEEEVLGTKRPVKVVARRQKDSEHSAQAE